MPRSDPIAACVHITRACVAACALALGGCAIVPALTLSASTSWRSRRDDAARSQSWSAGAQLGWPARGANPRASPFSEPNGALTGADAAAIAAAAAAACAFEATCRWEHAARSAALQRVRDLLDGELP